MDLSFSLVKLHHQLWKLKLRSFLDGKEEVTLAEAVSHRDCELGKWLYSSGLEQYGSEPSMRKLEQIHADFHNEVREVVELKTRGKIAEAEIAYQKIRPLSDQVIDLLDIVEQKVR